MIKSGELLTHVEAFFGLLQRQALPPGRPNSIEHRLVIIPYIFQVVAREHGAVRSNHTIDFQSFFEKRIQHGDIPLHILKLRPFSYAGQVTSQVNDGPRDQHALLRDINQNVGHAVSLAEIDHFQPKVSQVKRVFIRKRNGRLYNFETFLHILRV